MNRQQTYKESSFFLAGWMRGTMLVYDNSLSPVRERGEMGHTRFMRRRYQTANHSKFFTRSPIMKIPLSTTKFDLMIELDCS